MSIELIGIITFLLGLLTLRKGPDFGIYALAFLMLLGMAAAIKLPALGNASIQPAHFFLPFYVLAIARQKGTSGRLLQTLAFPRTGYWLAAFIVYGVITAALLPLLFAGDTMVFSLSRGSVVAARIVSALLAPSANNITQSVYLIGDLMLFVAVSAHIMQGGARTITAALLFAASANIVFAVLDVVTYWTHTAGLLDIIRNANYAFAATSDVAGFKRIAGSFSEASSFGAATLVLFVFSAELWLSRQRHIYAGVIALLSALLLVMSTSTSTYFGLAVYCALLGARCLWALSSGRASARHVTILFGVPLAALIIGLGLALIPGFTDAAAELLDRVVFNKLLGHSGIERSIWNDHAMQAFFDTRGLGAGVGSIRSSSYPVALLAGVGIIGTLLFVAFLAALIVSARRARALRAAALMNAARWACLISLVPAAVSATTIDLGLTFFLLAALATAPRSAQASTGGARLGLFAWPRPAGVPA